VEELFKGGRIKVGYELESVVMPVFLPHKHCMRGLRMSTLPLTSLGLPDINIQTQGAKRHTHPSSPYPIHGVPHSEQPDRPLLAFTAGFSLFLLWMTWSWYGPH